MPALDASLNAQNLAEDFEDLKRDLDTVWVLLGAFLVFIMQAGFTMLEGGCVRTSSVDFILRKNVMDACLSGVLWYIVGYGLAFGENGGGFIGLSKFVWSHRSKDFSFFADWVFSWTFAATAATIVSGAVAERCCFQGYMRFASFMTVLIYPPVVHWTWSSSGWLSMFGENEKGEIDPSSNILSTGLMDFAGSGVVHLTGGGAALMGAWIIGPREGRFTDANADAEFKGSSFSFAALGTMLMWFGWYGFNAGSTGCLVGCMRTAAKIAMNTTISASAGGGAVVMLNVYVRYYPAMTSEVLNGIIGGLVSITASCAMVEAYSALIIGLIGGAVYYFADAFLKKRMVDDPLGAAAVHLGCGVWGVISVGIFATKAGVETAYQYEDAPGYGLVSGFDEKSLRQLAVQILGAVLITLWSMTLSGLFFKYLERNNMLREQPQRDVDPPPQPHAGGSFLS